MADSAKIKLGSSNDLQLYHDGSNSYVEDAGTGLLYIKSDGLGIKIQSAWSGTLYDVIDVLAIQTDIKVSGTTRFSATSTGATVGGNLIVTGNTSLNVADGFMYLSNIGTGNAGIYVRGIGGSNILRSHSTGQFTWEVSGGEKMRLTSGGNLGIGTSSPSNLLHLKKSSDYEIYFENAASGGEIFRLAHGTSGLFMRGPNTSNLLFGWTQDHDVTVYNSSGSEYAKFDGGTSRLGLGTSSPGSTLDVHGNTNLGSDNIGAQYTTTLSGFSVTANGSDYYGSYGTLVLNSNQNYTSASRFWMITNAFGANKFAIISGNDATTEPGIGTGGAVTNGAARLYITNGGGVTIPGTLGVESDVTVPNINVADDIRHSDDSDTYISFESNSQIFYSGGTRSIDLNPGSIVLNEGGADQDFRVEGVGSSHLLFADAGNARVGIGTSSPTRTLDVIGDFGVKKGSSAVAFNEYNNGAQIWLDGSNGDFTGGDYFNIGAFGTTDLSFGYAAGVSMTLKNDGKLGIGTASPVEKLTIQSGNINFMGGTNDAQYIKFGDSDDANIGELFYYHGNNNMVFVTNASEAMRIDSSGNVGIGTSSPTHTLHVAGNVRINAGSSLRLYNSAGNAWAQIAYDATNDSIQVQRSFIASTNNYYNLGTSAIRWATVYATNLDVTNFSPTNIAITSGTVKLDGDHPDGSNNVALGDGAGANFASGANRNTAIGHEALTTLTTGDYNVAVGWDALRAEDTGERNTAVGYAALRNLDYNGAAYNTGVGFAAGELITTGIYNTLVGGLAGDAMTTGERNTGLGFGTLTNTTTPDNNTAVGFYALQANVGGSRNTGVGSTALYNMTQASATNTYNTGVGYAAGYAITSGVQNTLIGADAGVNITTGSYNDALGMQALAQLTTGSNNIAIGAYALDAATTTGQNTAVGSSALTGFDHASSGFNTAVGYNSQATSSSGRYNTSIASPERPPIKVLLTPVVTAYPALHPTPVL